MVQISWDDAQAFCDWAGLQLPTRAGMGEGGAGHRDGRVWPWGDELPTADHCNFNNNIGTTTPVGRYSPHGDSPYGCVDMAGNVWEWTVSWYGDGQTSRVLRGGSWLNYRGNVRVSIRGYLLRPDFRYIINGFRVAAPVVSGS